MADYSLTAQPRAVVGKKVKQLRRDGLVPVNVFGPDQASVVLQVPYRELELLLAKAGGNHLININADGESYSVLARHVQRDVIRGTILHVDFMAVGQRSRVTVDVPLTYTGVAPAVDSGLGTLVINRNTLSVEMRADQLVDQLEADLSGLATLADSLFARDVVLPRGATLVGNPDDVLVAIVGQTVEPVADDTTPAEPEIVVEESDAEGEGDAE